MILELVEFPNTDNIMLPALLYSPEQRTDTVVIALHGNGSSGGFYNIAKNNALGQSLTSAGYSYLTFSNIGAHMIQKFDKILDDGTTERVTGGVAYELIKHCVQDIDGAINYVKGKGYNKVILLGQSTGANKICVYHKYCPKNEVAAYILTSGGDDSGLFYVMVGAPRFKMIINNCQQKIREGKGRFLASKYTNQMVITYQSLLDQIDPDGEYNIFPFYWSLNNIAIMKKEPFIEFKQLNKPTLVVYGLNDQYCFDRTQDCVALLKHAAGKNKHYTFKTIADADHSFTNKEKVLASEICNWVTNILLN